MSRFDEKEYRRLKHRVEQLQSRINLDYEGPEKETAKRLLEKVKSKLKAYEQTHEIPVDFESKAEYSKSSSFDFWENFATEYNNYETDGANCWNPNSNFKWNVHFEEDERYSEDIRSESQMADDLGVIYMIFGSTYQTILNYHVYKIRFKKQLDKQGAFFRVYSDVYEDDIRICENVIIGFWPFNWGDDRCGDMEFSDDGDAIRKYNHGCSMLYEKLTSELKDIWNSYFEPLRLTMNVSGYITDTSDSTNQLEEQLSEEQREQVIKWVEEAIDNGIMTYAKALAIPIAVRSFKQYFVLSKFLDESGVVYCVDKYGVYIWNFREERYRRLVDYKYDKRICNYILYVI